MAVQRSTPSRSPPATADTRPSGTGSTPDDKQHIPQTSPERLAAEAADRQGADEGAKPDTILYLAYGSNMAAQTFQGMRGIRPLSQVNVSVPTLRLTFDLPGIPYREPCFANVDFRKMPEKPILPTPPLPLPEWDGGLMGVVYEVTKSDYRDIMRTEGGGTSYKEIYVPCIPLPAGVQIPERPPFDKLPKPFVARTLYCPSLPQDVPVKRKWWQRLFSRPNRSGSNAQASERYLNLLRDGAREHELPEVYQKYLNSLQSYQITSWKQMVGQVLLLSIGGPAFLAMVTIGRFFADENGKFPAVLAAGMSFIFNAIWGAYDCVFKPLFGDGERTMEPGKTRTGVVAAERRPLLG